MRSFTRENDLRILLMVFLISTLFGLERIRAQDVLVEYKNLSPGIFSTEQLPVGIALFPITQNNKVSGHSVKLYEELTTQYGIHEKFLIYPYNTIQEQLGISNLTPDDLSALANIRQNLDIKFIVFGSIIDLNHDWFILKIANTLDGKIVFEGEFRNSNSSTGIKDAVELLSNDKMSYYSEIGRIVIYLQPKDAIVQIDSVKYSKFDEITLGVGSHNIEITKKGYETIYEQVNIEHSKRIIKRYTLARQFGNLKVNVIPPEANIKLVSSGKTINSWKGNKLVTNIPVEDYEIQCELLGYEILTRKISINPNETTYEDIELIKTPFATPIISTNNDNVKDLRLESSGKDLLVHYDLLGESDDEYEIKLILIQKSGAVTFEAKSVSGDIGKGKFAGVDKKIVWRVEEDLTGTLSGDDYALELQVEKLGGGIAWYIYALGAALGVGVAAILVGSKGGEGDDPSSPSVIGSPPGRP